MATSNLGSLTTLIKRLEAATSRLEDLADATADPEATQSGLGAGNKAGSASAPPPKPGNSSPPPTIAEPLPPAITGYDTFLNGDVKTFVAISQNLGGLVAEQAASVQRTFEAERVFLVVTTKAKKPDIQSAAYADMFKELQSKMGAVDDIRHANRQSPLFNHLNTVADGMSMIGWVTIEPKPVESVKNALDSAKFYGNRVYKEYKDKDHSHIEWLQAYYRIFNSLTEYIKEYYPSGVTWNNKDGIDSQEALRQVQSGEPSPKPSSSSGGPPPPPPLPKFDGPPPPYPMPTNSAGAAKGTADMGAVFDQLSKGEAVTAGLRKVDQSQQTHKNPSLRTSSAVPVRSDSQQSTSSRGKSPVPGKRPKPESMRTKKPPRKELDGNKWIIENYEGGPDGVAEVEIDAAISHSILVTRCSNTIIRVLNKANAISVDSSARVSLIIDSLVSSVDVIKTARFEMQVLGTLPTVLLDQVDGATVYLSRHSLATEVFTSKCTAVNVNVPGRDDDEDYSECPLPEQIKTVIRDGVAFSEIVEHAG